MTSAINCPPFNETECIKVSGTILIQHSADFLLHATNWIMAGLTPGTSGPPPSWSVAPELVNLIGLVLSVSCNALQLLLSNQMIDK